MKELNRHLKALDFDKILERLEGFASCADTKELVWEVRPETELADAEILLNQTSDAHALLAKFGGPSFGGLKNVNNLLHVANGGGTLSMRDLLDVASTLRALRNLSDWYSQCSGIDTSLVGYFNVLTYDKYLEDRIFTSILSEDEMADSASKDLADIRKALRNKESSIRDKLDHIIHSEHYRTALQDAIVTIRNGRYVVPVKREHKSTVAGLVQDTSDSGATVFIEPMSVVEANNEIKVLLGKEYEEIEKILGELSAAAGLLYEDVKMSYEAAVYLNLVFAKAQLAYSMKASLPILNDQGMIDLKGARHPLIDPKKVVKTDIRLGDSFDTLVITGPNTGGKTVSIKTIGLMSIMAACGMMLPVSDNSKVAVFKNIFADIGDEQSIEQSLSTFSSHMTNIVDIMSKAGRGTLVLIDELGAGTDPIEGAALAMAILEKLHEQGATIAATTHYAELKAYALEADHVENGCCEFDVNTLSPTYRLLIGVPGRSNAFAISERLGISPEVVNRARDLVSAENTRFEDVVEKLEESRAQMESEHQKALELSAEARLEKENAQKLRDDIERLKNEEVEKARNEAMRIVERARREAAYFLDDIENMKKEQKKAQDLSKLSSDVKLMMKRHESSLDDITNPIIALAMDEDYVLPRDLIVGDTVVIADIGTTAIVSSLPDKKGMVEVTSGIMKSRVELSKLRLVENPKKKNSGNKKAPSGRGVNRSISSKSDMKVETSVDLRGMASDEAIMTLDQFIDLQVRVGIGEFTVIHGKGTGVLRKAVKQYLGRHPQVKEFRLGTFGEGEDGVTIVKLK